MVTLTLMATDRPHRRLGERLGSARAALNLNQADVARAADLTQGYINRIENGERRPRPEKLRRIARFLGLDYNAVSALAGYSDDEPEPDIGDPELDLLFRQVKTELPPEDLEAVKEQMKLAMRLRRERLAREAGA